jgi:hypothetical protein
MSSALVKLLAEVPTPRLNERQAEVREELSGIDRKREELKHEDDLISLALAERHNDSTQAPRRKSTTEINGDATSQRLDPGARGERREIYREILSNQADRSLTVAEIVAAVEAREIETNPHAARAMLRRMARDGEIERVDYKHWKLASVNGSLWESPTEASSVGPGGEGGESPWPPDDGSGASAAPNRPGVPS